MESVPLLSAGYTTLNCTIPEPAGGLVTIICRALCCGGKNASHDDPGRAFPRNPTEFGANGVGWVNAVMSDRLGANSCTKVVSHLPTTPRPPRIHV